MSIKYTVVASNDKWLNYHIAHLCACIQRNKLCSLCYCCVLLLFVNNSINKSISIWKSHWTSDKCVDWRGSFGVCEGHHVILWRDYYYYVEYIPYIYLIGIIIYFIVTVVKCTILIQYIRPIKSIKFYIDPWGGIAYSMMFYIPYY